MTKELFEQYAQLEAQAKDIKEKQDELKPQLLEEMKADGEDKIQEEFGTFSVVKRKSYEFAEETIEKVKIIQDEITEKTTPLQKQIDEITDPLQGQITELETEDKETGKGEETISESFRFQAKK